MTSSDHSFSTREIALISVFSAIWIGAEMTLGPIIGRIPVGPFAMHGSVNRIVGWFLMVLLANLSGKFGRVSVMSVVASLATRLIRLSAIEALVAGAGYALGGVVFDMMYFASRRLQKGVVTNKAILIISIVSGFFAIVPYLLLQLYVFGVPGFLLTLPRELYSSLKGILLSLAGATVANVILNTRSFERALAQSRRL